MNSAQQREALEWFNEWQIPCTKEQLLSLSRGPFRECLNFLVGHARTDGFIDTLRTNLYLQEGSEGSNGDFMQSEINDALFSEKEAKLKELQQEKERLETEIYRKKEILRKKSEPLPRTATAMKRDLCLVLNERIQNTEAMIAQCETIEAENNLDETGVVKEEKTKKNVEALQQAAHEAFQGMVMRHYLLEGRPDTPLSDCGLTAEEFNELVMKVLGEADCGKCISDWVRQEREHFIKICQDQARNMSQQGQSGGFQLSINDKMNKLITSWSNAQVQAHMKNNAREAMLAEAEEELKRKQHACKNNPNIGFRLSDFTSLIRLKLANAKRDRCKQHNAGNAKPIDNVFGNVSTECFATPSPDKEIETLFDFDTKESMKDWVGAIADLEQIQELYAVLQKTWKSGKVNLSEMLRSAQRPKTELGPTLLQTIETIKLTVPKSHPITASTSSDNNANSSYHSDVHSMHTISLLSNAQGGPLDASTLSTTSVTSAGSSVSSRELECDELRDDVSVVTDRISIPTSSNETLDETQFPGLSEARKFLEDYKQP